MDFKTFFGHLKSKEKRILRIDLSTLSDTERKTTIVFSTHDEDPIVFTVEVCCTDNPVYDMTSQFGTRWEYDVEVVVFGSAVLQFDTELSKQEKLKIANCVFSIISKYAEKQIHKEK